MATVAEAKRKNWTESVFRAHCSMRFKKKPNQTPGIQPRTANSTTKVETWRKILKKLSWKWEKVPRRCCEEDWCASPTVQKVRPTCVLLFLCSSEALLVFFLCSSCVLPVCVLCSSCVRPVFVLCSSCVLSSHCTIVPLYHCTIVPLYHCTTVPLLTVPPPPPPPPPLNYSCTTTAAVRSVSFHSPAIGQMHCGQQRVRLFAWDGRSTFGKLFNFQRRWQHGRDWFWHVVWHGNVYFARTLFIGSVLFVWLFSAQKVWLLKGVAQRLLLTCCFAVLLFDFWTWRL